MRKLQYIKFRLHLQGDPSKERPEDASCKGPRTAAYQAEDLSFTAYKKW